MCLTTKQIEPKVATEDITCYKVLNIRDNGEYQTPYFSTIIPPEIIEGKKALKPELKEGETFFDKKLHVEGKCIHSYATEKNALFQLTYFSEVFECVIPKGALYYEGESNDYASSEIRFVKRIAERKETERVLSLKDIGKLDWDLDKDNIIKLFDKCGFLHNECDDKCKVPSGIGEVEPIVSEEEKTQMEELKNKNEALSYRLYLAFKYLEVNEAKNGEVIIAIVRRIFDQEPEVIIDIKQALDLFNFYFDSIKPLQKVCRIDAEATACAIASQKLIGKEATIVDYVKGVIETCNAVLSKITE